MAGFESLSKSVQYQWHACQSIPGKCVNCCTIFSGPLKNWTLIYDTVNINASSVHYCYITPAIRVPASLCSLKQKEVSLGCMECASSVGHRGCEGQTGAGPWMVLYT